ncbi:MAG: DnaB-like helicase C-terminal domain-containing protein [Nitrososphaerales archaeon]
MIEDLSDFDVEQSVLGLILSQHYTLDKVRDKLDVEDFHFSDHQDIFAIACRLQDEGKRPSPIEIRPILQSQWMNKETGPILVHIVSCACVPITLDSRCDTIKDFSNRRKLSIVADVLCKESHNLDLPLEEVTSKLEGILDEVSDTDEEWKTVALADVMDEVYDILESDEHQDFVPTGIENLDNIIDGLFPSRLYVIGAPPGCAKTTLALNIALNVSKSGNPVAFFNLEMANREMVPRIITNYCYENREIAYRNFARKDFSDPEMELIREARGELNRLPIIVRDEPSVTISKLRRECRKIKRKIPDLKVVVVDYIQLMKPESRYKGNKVQEVSEISRGLKLLAKELNIAVVALSQLSRSHENRDNKRPQNSDLRDSGAIEQDANVIMFNFYEHKYLSRDEPKDEKKWDEWLADVGKLEKKIEIIVDKNREGATGVAHCEYSAPAAAIR